MHLLLEGHPKLRIHHLDLELGQALLNLLLLRNPRSPPLLLSHGSAAFEARQVLQDLVAGRRSLHLKLSVHLRVLNAERLVRPQPLVAPNDRVDLVVDYVHVHDVIDNVDAVGERVGLLDALETDALIYLLHFLGQLAEGLMVQLHLLNTVQVEQVT